MDPRDYLARYVERRGGIAATALRLRIPYPTLASILNGHRGISRRMAERMHAADPKLKPEILVWVAPTREAA